MNKAKCCYSTNNNLELPINTYECVCKVWHSIYMNIYLQTDFNDTTVNVTTVSFKLDSTMTLHLFLLYDC
jgi:hypothetical protein